MSTGTGIQWTDCTWNPTTGCTRVSAGCDHCYAVGMTHRLESIERAHRKAKENDSELNDPAVRNPSKYSGLTVLNGRGDRHFNGKVRCVEESLRIPLGWKKPRRVFVNSMSDLFHKEVPFEFIDKVFAVMALTPQHTYQVLTKRPERMAEYLNWIHPLQKIGDTDRVDRWCAAMSEFDGKPSRPRFIFNPLPNVWLGASCENQDAADARIPHLPQIPTAVRFLSLEPLLGHIDLATWFWSMMTDDHKCAISWVICGGESGKGARPCDVSWIRSIVQQCKAAGVPCFVKQLGSKPKCEHAERHELKHTAGCRLCKFYPPEIDHKGGDPSEWPEDLRVREFPGGGA